MAKLNNKDFLGEISRLAEEVRRDTAPATSALSFRDWCNQVSPTFRWDWPHLAYIRARVEPIIEDIGKAVTGRHEEKKAKHLILSVPPRHGKSEQVTNRLPANILEKWPKTRVIVGAYNSDLACRFSRKTRRIAASRFALSKDRNTAGEWETEEEGGLRAVGAGGGVTGHGGHLIIIDDPVKSREEASSATYRENIWAWFTDDIYTRLEPGGAVIIIMTRWHEDDLVGRILKSDFVDDFEVINLPAEAEYDDVLGRPLGAALCPDRFNEDALAKLRTVLGRGYYSLYQGRPAAEEGDIINVAWFKRYNYRVNFKRVIQSWDTAQKVGKANDYSTCLTFGELENGDSYLLDVLRKKLEYPGLKRAFAEQHHKWRPTAVLLEDKGHGTALGQEFRQHPGYRIIMVEPEGDKVTRMSIESSYIEGGRMYLPENAQWLPEFENECTNFPIVKHDDQVDAMSQYLRWLRNPSKKMADYLSVVFPWL